MQLEKRETHAADAKERGKEGIAIVEYYYTRIYMHTPCL
jgi:hypothetical protein